VVVVEVEAHIKILGVISLEQEVMAEKELLL